QRLAAQIAERQRVALPRLLLLWLLSARRRGDLRRWLGLRLGLVLERAQLLFSLGLDVVRQAGDVLDARVGDLRGLRPVETLRQPVAADHRIDEQEGESADDQSSAMALDPGEHRIRTPSVRLPASVL